MILLSSSMLVVQVPEGYASGRSVAIDVSVLPTRCEKLGDRLDAAVRTGSVATLIWPKGLSRRPGPKGAGMTAYRTIRVDGTEVFYREGGEHAASTLLLLHGFPSSSAQYEQLMQRLEDRYHVIAPDYPGFGQSPPLEGTTTFDRLADVIDGFTDAKRLNRFSLYMFDFGSPVGFRLASRHPERVQGLVLQNGNAYETGLGPSMQALKPYWQDRSANEDAIRASLQLDATRSQYLDGVADATTVNPDLWELDQRYLDLPGRDRVMLNLLYDYQNNVKLYPRWHEYLRTSQPPALLPWGQNDRFFPPEGARAYLQDLPDAELHLLDTGHFATATHHDEIAELVAAFLDKHIVRDGSRRTAIAAPQGRAEQQL
jgi:pimeloyl-ACP methyl ester carboxylesterase